MSKFSKTDAQQVLNNAAFKRSIERIHEDLDARILACMTPEDFYRAGVAKQIATKVTRELQRIIAEGEAAEIELELIEQTREPFKIRKFQR